MFAAAPKTQKPILLALDQRLPSVFLDNPHAPSTPIPGIIHHDRRHVQLYSRTESFTSALNRL